MQNATGGVNTKVYGKRGRRERAYERLQKRYETGKKALVEYEKTLTALEKKHKLDVIEKHVYTNSLQMAASIKDALPRMEKELATLKTRI